MAHSICTATRGEGLSYLQELWNQLLDPDLDMGSNLERLFASETSDFDLDYGFLSRIDSEAGTEHFEVVHGPSGSIEAGETVPLAETYCRKTIADRRGTMTVDDALAEGWHDDPAYERFGFGSYVGTVVTVENELYGTLCFANGSPRDEPIVDREVSLVEMFAQWVTYELNQWTGPPTIESVTPDLDEQPGPPTPQIDRMMDALGAGPRRFILGALLDESTETDLDVLERAGDEIDVQAALHHTHLPKLAAAGYIEWDDDANAVSRGPNFPEVEPLVRFLKHFSGESPE